MAHLFFIYVLCVVMFRKDQDKEDKKLNEQIGALKMARSYIL